MMIDKDTLLFLSDMRIDELESENDKLCELVCEMSKYLHCPTNGITEGCPPCPLYDREEDECKIDLCKRKLGIEG